jgi:hypothetical protein
MSYRNFNMTYIELITIALVKRLILDPRMKAGDRLRALEGITAWIRPSGLTVEMLELVDPASDVEMVMIDAAGELDPKPFPNYEIPYPPDAITVPPSFYVLSDSFEHFAKLNKGIAAAIEHAQKWETAA